MNITGICPYETPCGWCSKWDKKCDKKIPERGQRTNINPVDDAIDDPSAVALVNKMCASESDHEWECCEISAVGIDCVCKKCGARKTYTSEYHPLSVTI